MYAVHHLNWLGSNSVVQMQPLCRGGRRPVILQRALSRISSPGQNTLIPSTCRRSLRRMTSRLTRRITSTHSPTSAPLLSLSSPPTVMNSLPISLYSHTLCSDASCHPAAIHPSSSQLSARNPLSTAFAHPRCETVNQGPSFNVKTGQRGLRAVRQRC